MKYHRFARLYRKYVHSSRKRRAERERYDLGSLLTFHRVLAESRFCGREWNAWYSVQKAFFSASYRPRKCFFQRGVTSVLARMTQILRASSVPYSFTCSRTCTWRHSSDFSPVFAGSLCSFDLSTSVVEAFSTLKLPTGRISLGSAVFEYSKLAFSFSSVFERFELEHEAHARTSSRSRTGWFILPG